MAQSGNTYGDAKVSDRAAAIFGNVYGNIILQTQSATGQILSGILIDGAVLYPELERQNHVLPTYTIETLIVRDKRASGRQAAINIELQWHKREDLGSGLFGIVHREECYAGSSLVKSRAVKVMRLRQLHDSQVDYKREIAALSRLSNPSYSKHFVQLYDWYVQDAHLYLAMEYVSGGDLFRYIGNGLPESDAKQIAIQVLEGIKVMHSLDIVHRDIKPANILVVRHQPEWWVKIADFSICKSTITQRTNLHTNIGTTGYQAPEILGLVEQEKASQYNSKCDIWSFGCMLFELLTGSPPFTLNALANYCFENNPSNLVQWLARYTISWRAQNVLRCLLAPDPCSRPCAETALLLPEWHQWLTIVEIEHVIDYQTGLPKIEKVRESELQPGEWELQHCRDQQCDEKPMSLRDEEVVIQEQEPLLGEGDLQLRRGKRVHEEDISAEKPGYEIFQGATQPDTVRSPRFAQENATIRDAHIPTDLPKVLAPTPATALSSPETTKTEQLSYHNSVCIPCQDVDEACWTTSSTGIISKLRQCNRCCRLGIPCKWPLRASTQDETGTPSERRGGALTKNDGYMSSSLRQSTSVPFSKTNTSPRTSILQICNAELSVAEVEDRRDNLAGSRTETRTTDDGETSGEESKLDAHIHEECANISIAIESRVARIKSRIAELTANGFNKIVAVSPGCPLYRTGVDHGPRVQSPGVGAPEGACGFLPNHLLKFNLYRMFIFFTRNGNDHYSFCENSYHGGSDDLKHYVQKRKPPNHNPHRSSASRKAAVQSMMSCLKDLYGDAWKIVACNEGLPVSNGLTVDHDCFHMIVQRNGIFSGFGKSVFKKR